MSPTRRDKLKRFAVLSTLLLWLAASLFLSLVSTEPASALQHGDEDEELKSYLAGLDNKEENWTRRLCFEIVKGHLPKGSKAAMTSGYRSPQDQLNVMVDLAHRYNQRHPESLITIPAVSLDNPSSWKPLLTELRAKQVMVNAPLKGHGLPVSAHTNPVAAVFDIAGDNLEVIKKACIEAGEKGELKLNQCLIELENGAVHVDVEYIPLLGLNIAFNRIGRIGNAAANSINSSPTQVAEVTDAQNAITNSYQYYANQAKSHEEKIGIYEKLISVLEKSSAYTNREVIEKYKTEIELLKKESERRQLLGKADALVKERRFTEAEEVLGKKSDDDEVRCRLAEVKYEMARNTDPSNNCDVILTKLQEAQALIEKDSKAGELKRRIENFKRDTENTCARVRGRNWLRVILVSLLAVGLIVSAFFLFRTGAWVLHCEDGDQHGESFSLDQPEIIIGSLGEPDGEAQIVINDRKRKISRNHCLVKQSGRRFYLKDLKSANGTLVNGRRLEADEYHELKKGDEISLAGAVTLIVRR